MRTRLGFVVAGLLLGTLGSLGCGGGGGGGDLAPPANLAVVQGPGFDVLLITWAEPSGSVDGYEIAGRVGDGAWETYPDLIPAPAEGVLATLDPSVPELMTLGVRLRSVRGSARSAWTPEATLLRTVRPPSGLLGAVSTAPNGAHVPPVHLTWTNASLVATAVQLERAPGFSPDEASFVPVATLDLPEVEHDDEQASEGHWTYRIRAGAGGTWGPWAVGWLPDTVDVVPPKGLAVSLEEGGVRLTWTNRSTLAQQLIRRIEPNGFSGLIATLAVGSHEYLDDHATAVWPATRYDVTAAVEGQPGATAATLEVPVDSLTVPGPVPLAGSARLAPGALHMALTDGGLLHVASWSMQLAIERDTGDGWEHHELPGAIYYALPAVLADGAGGPHTVWYQGYPEFPDTALVHDWHDRTGWRSEVVTIAPAEPATFALASGGALHVLARRREPSGSYTTVHHVATGGTVTSTDVVATVLPEPPPGSIGPYYEVGRSMAVAQDGTAWIAMTYSAPPLAQTTFVVFRRSVAGGWSQEALPPPSYTMSQAVAVAGSADAVGILYGWTARLRGAGGWGPEEAVAVPRDGMELRGAALAPDGVRLHALLSLYPDGLWLSARGAGGWEAELLGSPPPPWARIGFTAGGRATVVVPHGPDMMARAWVSLFVEPP